ncbi:DUF5348 domain-containing protein [Paenibacillus koleovorans]|uniref:DUF5348 domain-containing protein n=1 Tax=Paenibacillus koleovorans TaxID=121608 RepID=UPI000FD7FA78|nr:DUF5348 domain-containing protein [Paenibacillus koleovorans]
MTGRWLKMAYDRDGACWMIRLSGRLHAIHCGECFEMRVGDRGIPCRLELDRQWYVIMRETKFNLRMTDRYQIRFV